MMGESKARLRSTGTRQAASLRATNRCGVLPSCSTFTSGRASSIGSSKVRYEVSDVVFGPDGDSSAAMGTTDAVPGVIPAGPPQ